jgi:hypothetical protein
MATPIKTLAQRAPEAGPFVPDRCRVQPSRRVIDIPILGAPGAIWFRCELFNAAGEGYGLILAGHPDRPPTMEIVTPIIACSPELFCQLA